MFSEMPADRVSAGIDAFGDELVAELDDQLDDLGHSGARTRVRSPGARLERRVALDAVAGDELGDPALRHVVVPGDVDGATAFDNDGSDDKTGK